MKHYILTDLEGAAGVTTFERWCTTGGDRYDLARKLLSEEVNACARGIRAADPDAEIVAWDGHGAGGLAVEELDEHVQLLPRGPVGAALGMDESYDAAFFLAQHAMAGTPKANMSHSYSYENHEGMWLNDREMGEIGIRATAAGVLGIPVVFVSGDDLACAEAEELVPGIRRAVVKKAIDRECAQTLSPKGARVLIEKVAAEAVGAIGKVEPLRMEPPYCLKIRFAKDGMTDGVPTRGKLTVEDERTVSIRSADIFDFPL